MAESHDEKWLDEEIERQAQKKSLEKSPCDECGNKENILVCSFEDDRIPLCFECAEKTGFCLGCGQFRMGINSFDFPEPYGNIPGYCDECSDEINNSNDDYEDEYPL